MALAAFYALQGPPVIVLSAALHVGARVVQVCKAGWPDNVMRHCRSYSDEEALLLARATGCEQTRHSAYSVQAMSGWRQ